MQLKGDFIPSREIFSINYDEHLTITCDKKALSYSWVIFDNDAPVSISKTEFKRYCGTEIIDSDGTIVIESKAYGNYTINVKLVSNNSENIYSGSIVILGSVEQTFCWNYSGQTYTIEVSYGYAHYIQYEEMEVNRSPIYSYYLKFVTDDDPVLIQLSSKIEESVLKSENDDIPNVVLSFVQQCISYPPSSTGGTSPMSADMYLKGHDNYVLFPVESLFLEMGDCEDKSLLYSAIMESLGYETGIIIVPGHAMSCISLPAEYTSELSDCFQYNDHTFYVCETTVNGIEGGKTPPYFDFEGKKISEWLHLPNSEGYGYYIVSNKL